MGSTNQEPVVFMAGKDEFRIVRNYCDRACREFNKLTDDAPADKRVQAWLDIVDPARARFSVDDSAQTATCEIAYKDRSIRPVAPFVKGPFRVDYGVRLYVAPTTFINRDCVICDTPVADIRIGEDCMIGPQVGIYGVTHSEVPDEDTGKRESIGIGVTIADQVWIGGGAKIMPGVTIGAGSIVAAGSIVTKDVRPGSIVAGNPAIEVRKVDRSRYMDLRNSSIGELREALLIGGMDEHEREAMVATSKWFANGGPETMLSWSRSRNPG